MDKIKGLAWPNLEETGYVIMENKKSLRGISGSLDYYETDTSKSPLKIDNAKSEFGALFNINSPYQVTYEYCSGTSSDDYLNSISLSAKDTFFCQETYDLHNHHFHEAAPHFHNYFEIMMILSGTVVQRIENKSYLYTAGDCCLLNRNLRHYENFLTESRVIFIGLSVDYVKKLFMYFQNAAFNEEKAFLDSELYSFVMADIDNDKGAFKKEYLDFIPTVQEQEKIGVKMRDIAEDMILTLLFPSFGATLKMDSLMCGFLGALSSPANYHHTRVTLDYGGDFLLFMRIGRLLEECNGRITRAELEKRLNYSGHHINHIVNKYSGMCLYDYAMTFCLKKAAKDFADTGDSIGDIIARLGFTNRTHFYHMFRQMYGVTPKQMRARQKKD